MMLQHMQVVLDEPYCVSNDCKQVYKFYNSNWCKVGFSYYYKYTKNLVFSTKSRDHNTSIKCTETSWSIAVVVLRLSEGISQLVITQLVNQSVTRNSI